MALANRIPESKDASRRPSFCRFVGWFGRRSRFSFEEVHMRARLFLLIGLVAVSSSPAFAQMKLSPKSATSGPETRYFTSIDGLMDGNADVILKETRQGKIVTAAVLDVCYPEK